MKFFKASLLAPAIFFFSDAPSADAHGHMTFPPNRVNRTLQDAGNCENFACFWFSQPVDIPGEPVLNSPNYRTYNVNVNENSKRDWSRTHPWRAPGTAPIYGSGCGSAGGGPVMDVSSGGSMPNPAIPQGTDGVSMPAVPERDRAVWKRGSVQEVASAMLANHGGGWSWRICPSNATISEDCFQKQPLELSGDTQTLRYADITVFGIAYKIPDVKIPMTKWVDPKTGTEWARNPVPGCLFCNQADCRKTPSRPKMMTPEWEAEMRCSQSCSGLNATHCPPGTEQFPPEAEGVSGFDKIGAHSTEGFGFSIVDNVKVPTNVQPGDYLLSWRWDTEQTPQIWQNCADIKIV